MAILKTDIKLMASERMHDESDGGGRMSGNEIVDGVSNNMFPDVSPLDRTYGRLNLRKVFPAVLSDDTDTYGGAHAIVSKPPADVAVHCTMFKTSSADEAWVDERDAAQAKIEQYVTQGQLSSMVLIGPHYEGQRALLAYQRLTSKPPVAGEVYCVSDGTNTQFTRVTTVDIIEETYSDSSGDFTRNEITLGISDPLLYDFAGGSPHHDTDYQPAAKLYKTNAIPAVAYFGIQPLAEIGVFGERTIKAASYKGHLLPATQSEEALIDVNLANSTAFENSSGGGRDVSVSQIQETAFIYVDAGNRGYNYVLQLVPKPAPGTLQVAFRAQEKWYVLTDEDGSGQLVGAGSGSVNYTTGSVAVTLGDMPDVETRIIYGWGSGDFLERHDTDPAPAPPTYRYTVANAPIEPNTITITWNSGALSVTDDGSGGLSGDGTGFVIYATGYVEFTPTALMAPAEIPQLTYTKKTSVTEVFPNVTPDGATGLATVNLTSQPEANSVKVLYRAKTRYRSWSDREAVFAQEGATPANTAILNSANVQFTAHDDGAGALDIGSGACDYAGKSVTIDAKIAYQYRVRTFATYPYIYGSGSYGATRFSGWQTVSSNTDGVSADVEVTYTVTGAATQVYTEGIPTEKLKIDLIVDTSKSIYPGSVAFTMAGGTYWDYEGIIYRDGNYVVADAVESGTIDYRTGIVTFTDWLTGSPVVDILSLLVENEPWVVCSFTTYTALAPLRPAALTIAVTALDGELLTATTAADGKISGSGIRGYVDVETGIIDLEFGESVLDADLSADEKALDWYDASAVDGTGHIWRPRSVWPTTGRYNCVAYVYMPLSADILGIDPVRLPMDGRVPIYRVGDVIVIHHTQETAIATPTNGQEVDCGRPRLEWVKLHEADGTPVATSKYTVDLDAGTVTLDDVSGLATPLTLYDRIEDMALVNDLQINGTLGLTKALSHDFPLGTYVSSALIMGDIFSRVTNIFEQNTWTGAWSDDLIGGAPLASFNSTVYPITITNEGSTQERWVVIFTSSSTFKVVGEFSGQIAIGDTNSDCAPLNPATAAPYFTIPLLGWGLGWSTGNVLRFNTIAANRPVQVARTILQSETSSGADQFCIEVRGAVDTE